jgi:Protein of unknown function (DUF2934)
LIDFGFDPPLHLFSSQGGDMKTKHESLNDCSGGIDLDEFREMVAVNAYCIAEKRGFGPDHQIGDWLKAENEIKRQRRYWLR